jgi:hypothetical protein
VGEIAVGHAWWVIGERGRRLHQTTRARSRS